MARPSVDVGDLSHFNPEIRDTVAQVLSDHPELPRPGRDYPAWVTGSLGDPRADVWFVAENPSAGMAARRKKAATAEDQWRISTGDECFRKMLVAYGFKDGEWDQPGGWRCYLTDVIKSAFTVKDWDAGPAATRSRVAEWWRPVIERELAIGQPTLIVTVGNRAEQLLNHVARQAASLALPPAREQIKHYTYVMSRPEGKVRGGHPDRVAAWGERFAHIAHHPARRSAHLGGSQEMDCQEQAPEAVPPAASAAPEASAVEKLAALGVKGILRQLAEHGQLIDVRCEMPQCYCSRGRRYFAPNVPPSKWSPTADHYPRLKSHGGHLTADNVRLAHKYCNHRDWIWRQKINKMLGERMSLEQIADRLNEENVPTIHGTNRWTPASVRKAFVS